LERLQTRVYPYLLVRAGAALNGGTAFQPGQVEMIYWFTEPDQPPERLLYSAEQFAEDGQYLLDLIQQIAGHQPEAFTMTDAEARCRYCVYRSLCNRGAQAGSLADEAAAGYELESTGGLDFDLEQIGEIRF
jgi:hypothetical protein